MLRAICTSCTCFFLPKVQHSGENITPQSVALHALAHLMHESSPSAGHHVTAGDVIAFAYVTVCAYESDQSYLTF
jgi:hypothetical protein